MKKFKISELAKLFNISRQTLLYYDRIGILKPSEIDPNNGYRYYSPMQLLELSFIMILKNCNLSLNDIKSYVEIKEIQKGKEFLEKKEEEIDEKIRILKKAKKMIHSKIEIIDEFSCKNQIIPKIEIIENFYLLKVNLDNYDKNYETNAAFFQLIELVNKNKLDVFFVYFSFSSDSVINQEYPVYNNIGIMIEHELDGFEKFESKLYASIIHKGEFLNFEDSYRKLVKYINNNSYKIVGNPIIISNKSIIYIDDGYGSVFKIAIPVESQ